MTTQRVPAHQAQADRYRQAVAAASTDDIPTTGDLIDEHRAEALEWADRIENMARSIELAPLNSQAYRRINQRLSIAMKLASVHANLAVALSRSTGGQG